MRSAGRQESAHVPGGVAKLNLGRNALTGLTDDLAALTGLRTLELAYNRLASLPVAALAVLEALQLLDVSHNELVEFGEAGLRWLQSLVPSAPAMAHLHTASRLTAPVRCRSRSTSRTTGCSSSAASSASSPRWPSSMSRTTASGVCAGVKILALLLLVQRCLPGLVSSQHPGSAAFFRFSCAAGCRWRILGPTISCKSAL